MNCGLVQKVPSGLDHADRLVLKGLEPISPQFIRGWVSSAAFYPS
jgi:hypothetical protein